MACWKRSVSMARTMPASGSPCCARSTSSIGSASDGVKQLLGDGRKDEVRRLHQGCGAASDRERRKCVDYVHADAIANDDVGRRNARRQSNRLRATQGTAGASELDQISRLVEPRRATARTGSGSIPPSCAASNTTPARSTRLSSRSRPRTRRAAPSASARSAAAGATMAWSSRFRGEPVPATGFSIGVSRLQAALQLLGKLDTQAGARPGGGHGVRSRPHRATTRRWSRRCATPASAPSSISAIRRTCRPPDEICRQAQRALRGHPGRRREGQGRGADQGSDPRLAVAGLSKDRDDYLQKQAEAQFAVAEDALVEAVRKVLARHDITWGSLGTKSPVIGWPPGS